MKRIVLTLVLGLAAAPVFVSAQGQEPIRVGGNVKPPERIRYVAPVYPGGTQEAGVTGIVILEAVIGTDGTVTEVKVLKSVALLDGAALDAVRQWVYTPTTLNGVPVPVIMTVTVNFSQTGPQTTPVAQPQASVAAGESRDPVTLNGKTAIRVGGDVQAPERIKYVPPVYPQEAKDAQAQGIVILECLIDEQGQVVQAKILKSVALLDQAALDAVMQWKYTPTTLNGVPAPVVMTVTVNFTLRN